MSSYYQLQTPRHDDNVYYDESAFSSTTAMFPPDMSGSYMDNSQLLNIPQNVLNHRSSISTSSDLSFQQAYLSRPPSLSPSSQPMLPLHPAQQSPHSSASPSSNFSISATDEFLLANSFSANELDMFLFQNNDLQNPQAQHTRKQPLYLPQNRGFDYHPQPTTQSSLTQDDVHNRYSVVSESYPMPKMEYTNMASIQPSMQQWTPQPPFNPPLNAWQEAKPALQKYPDGIFPPSGQSLQQRQTRVAQAALPIAPLPRVTPSRRIPTAKPESLSPPEGPAVGKHNKTERRYRQKVQAAQANLRDSVPALRVLYGTSSDEQRRSTDFRATDGTVDGLGEITRPNASAKTTIFLGARLYIELLQRRVASLQRKVGELQDFRMAVAGEENLRKWQEDFDILEVARQAELAVNVEDDSFDDEDDEDNDEDEPKRKKPRATQKIRTAVRVFAAFAISFSLFPTASTLFKDLGPEGAEISDASSHQVLKRIPLITAEHISRLLAHGLPQGAVPHPHTIVDWGWRLIVALVLAVLLGPVVQQWTDSWSYEAKKPEAKKPSDRVRSRVVKNSANSVAHVEPDTGSEACLASAAQMIGGVVDRTFFSRWRVIVRLNRTAKDAYSLALLALLQPELPFFRTPQAIWKSARAILPTDASPALSAVLALPLEEAFRSLEFVPKTVYPIAAIAEQITLVHINDLYSRLFVRLVDASAKTGATSVQNLLDNLESRDLGSSLQISAFDREIRSVIEGVPKGSAAHALGLVLIGLWGLFVGPSPSAQAALASALAAEEVKGAGRALSSVSAMLELLYPGSSTAATLDGVPVVLPANALAIDRLAFVCIEYIRLLSSASTLNSELSRLQRLEASLSVQKATSHLRLVLTQTTFVGLAEDEEEDEESEEVEQTNDETVEENGERIDDEARSFLQAKERLVGVLSVVGRRAAGRATTRDEDSGLEGDIDEL